MDMNGLRPYLFKNCGRLSGKNNYPIFSIKRRTPSVMFLITDLPDSLKKDKVGDIVSHFFNVFGS